MSSSGPSWQAKMQGSSLAFVKPMPTRGEGAPGHRDSSFEMSTLGHEGAWASELWSKLQPSSDSNQHHPATAESYHLGHFQIEEQIGRGGMGAVFRAIDTRLDRVVALKVLSPSQSSESSSIERFRNEARAAARMDHENIARVYYIGEDQGLQFIAFEFVHGINVRQLIEKRGRLAPADAVNYALQIATALRHTDAAGVVHRDIKPSNIIITPAGRAKLVDLGLARKRDAQTSNDLTVDGTTLGTFDYISPEQAKDPRNVDVRSDIYSLGCTLFHMLTGEPPYPVGTMLQKLLDHQGKDIPDAAALNPRIPPELSAVVRKMMDSEPQERYATPDELIDDLSMIAHRFGLRPAPADGVVWSQPRAAEGWDLWKQYGGWIATAAMLLIVVFVIDRAQNAGVEQLSPDNSRSAAELRQSQEEMSSGNANGHGSPSIVSTGNARNDASGQLLIPSDSPLADAENSRLAQERLDQVTPPWLKPFTQAPSLNEEIPPPLSSLRETSTSPLTDPPTTVMRSPTGDLLVGDSQSKSQAAEQPSGTDAATMPDSQSLSIPIENPFIVLDSNNVRRGEYPTLEAACVEAPDNALIELHYNGDQQPVQQRIKIVGKRLRIRAGKEYRPTLRFAVSEERMAPGREEVARMISVSGGSLEIYNVDLVLNVDPHLPIGQWVLFSLSDAKSIELHGVTATIENQQMRPAALLEHTASLHLSFADEPPPAVKLLAEDCFFRGEADFLLDKTIDPAQVQLSNVAVGIDGALLRMEGTDEYGVLTDMNTGHDLELDLKHVTAILRQGLAQFDVQPNYSVPRLKVNAGDSVISARAPLISMQGELELREFRSRLTWMDDTTFLDVPNPVWRIAASDGTREFDRGQFDNEWLRNSRGSQFGAAGNLTRFQGERPFSKLTRRELQLDTNLPTNPAIAAASDGSTDAGVDWDAKNFPRLAGARPDTTAPPASIDME